MIRRISIDCVRKIAMAEEGEKQGKDSGEASMGFRLGGVVERSEKSQRLCGSLRGYSQLAVCHE